MNRTAVSDDLNSDPNVVALNFLESTDPSNVTGYFDGHYELYQQRLAPYINKADFEKYVGMINNTCMATHIGQQGVYCAFIFLLCTVFTSLCCLIGLSRRWIPMVEEQLKDEINPAIKDRNIAFELRYMPNGPYLVVHILVPVQQVQPVQQVVVVPTTQPDAQGGQSQPTVIDAQAPPPYQETETTATTTTTTTESPSAPLIAADV